MSTIKRRTRFTADVREKIVLWLENRVKTLPQDKLTWKEIEKFSGFSKMRLSQDVDVVEAYRVAKDIIRGGAPRRKRQSNRELELVDRVSRLEKTLKEMEKERDQWLQLWDRWQYNACRKGWDAAELERPLPPALHRKVPKAT